MLLQKFQSLVNGGSNQVGTNQETRNQIWNEFISEFPEDVYITIDGVDVFFKANHSRSGKSTTYFASITADQYIEFVGSKFGLSKKQKPHILICNGVIEICGGGKFYSKISNHRVTNILPF